VNKISASRDRGHDIGEKRILRNLQREERGTDAAKGFSTYAWEFSNDELGGKHVKKKSQEGRKGRDCKEKGAQPSSSFEGP